MTNVAWALIGGLAAGAGGTIAVWAFCAAVGETNPDNVRVVVTCGGAVAALAGGLLSVGRGGSVGTAGRRLRAAGLTALAGALLVSCYPFGAVWLVALGGGLSALAAVRALLRAVGIPDETPGRAGAAGAEPIAAADRPRD